MSQSWVVVEGDYGVVTLSGGVAGGGGASQRRDIGQGLKILMILGVG